MWDTVQTFPLSSCPYAAIKIAAVALHLFSFFFCKIDINLRAKE